LGEITAVEGGGDISKCDETLNAPYTGIINMVVFIVVQSQSGILFPNVPTLRKWMQRNTLNPMKPGINTSFLGLLIGFQPSIFFVVAKGNKKEGIFQSENQPKRIYIGSPGEWFFPRDEDGGKNGCKIGKLSNKDNGEKEKRV